MALLPGMPCLGQCLDAGASSTNKDFENCCSYSDIPFGFDWHIACNVYKVMRARKVRR